MSQYYRDAIPSGHVERTGWPRWLTRWLSDRVRRDQEAIDAQRIGELMWRWRQACELSGLARLVFTPSGQHMFIPRIGQVKLGPPMTSFIVRPQPGQLLSDFEAARPRIAAAMGVAEVRIRPLANEWIVLELVDGSAEVHRPEPPEVVELSPRSPTGPAPDGLAAA